MLPKVAPDLLFDSERNIARPFVVCALNYKYMVYVLQDTPSFRSTSLPPRSLFKYKQA